MKLMNLRRLMSLITFYGNISMFRLFAGNLKKDKTCESEDFFIPWQWWSCSWACVVQKSEPSPSTRWSYRLCRPGPRPQLPSLHHLKEHSSLSADWQTNNTIQGSALSLVRITQQTTPSLTLSKVSALVEYELYKKYIWKIVKYEF